MTIALAAVAASLATLVIVLVSQWIFRRGSRTDEQLTEVVRELEGRMDQMVEELTGALEQSQIEGNRTRMLGELAGSIDLDEVLTRVLEAAGAIDERRVDAVLGRGLCPNVGEDQCLLEPLPGGLVDLIGQAGGKLGAQRLPAA